MFASFHLRQAKMATAALRRANSIRISSACHFSWRPAHRSNHSYASDRNTKAYAHTANRPSRTRSVRVLRLADFISCFLANSAPGKGIKSNHASKHDVLGASSRWPIFVCHVAISRRELLLRTPSTRTSENTPSETVRKGCVG